MKKSIKRFLKFFPGGKKFIQNYKNLLIENSVLREAHDEKRDRDYKDFISREKSETILSEDYKVFFHR